MMADKSSFSRNFNKSNVNLVEYFIFSKELLHDSFISEIFAFLSYKCHLSKYIWQYDPFNLKLISETAELPGHLYGYTHYGDNIEDEWYIVYLLVELSKKYEDFMIRIVDEDGEFLLIEAAENLPSRYQQEVADNRVFIHKGKVHIVDRDQSEGVINIRDVLACLISNPDESIASLMIQKDISSRLKGYPEKISEMKHTATCYIPANLSALLDTSPTLISSIVSAFYERDSLDMKYCVTFKYFQPGTRVMRKVQMTRCLYAQLMQQKFNPDPRSGFTLPHINSQKFKAHDLGAKLAHGAEILCRTGFEGFQSDLTCDPIWIKFHKSLISDGYFKDELEGSKLYKDLLTTAKSFYLTTIVPYVNVKIGHHDAFPKNTSETINNHEKQSSDLHHIGHTRRDHAGAMMLSFLKNLEVDIESLRKEADHMGASDDDSWMDIGPEELEAKLNKYFTGKIKDENAIGKMPEKFQSFVNQKSSHLGVELPESEDNEVFIEPDMFMMNFQEALDFDDPKNSSSDSELDEYDSASDEEEIIPNGKDSSRLNDVTLKNIMGMMDKELSCTKVGKSFVPKSEETLNNVTLSHKTSWATWGKKECSNHPRSERHVCEANIDSGDESEGDSDDFKPVDVDMNLVQNLLKSYSAQRGESGPSSVIMNSLGLSLPPLDSDDDDDAGGDVC